VDNLVGYWGKPFAPYGLGNDMLTMFGWHMRSSVSERHGSLMGATTALGPRHVREILNLLKATVPRNPRFAHYPEYGTNTADDYEWYAQEVADQLGPYWEQRRDLIRWIRDAWVKSSSAGVTTFDYYFLILPDMKAS